MQNTHTHFKLDSLTSSCVSECVLNTFFISVSFFSLPHAPSVLVLYPSLTLSSCSCFHPHPGTSAIFPSISNCLEGENFPLKSAVVTATLKFQDVLHADPVRLVLSLQHWYDRYSVVYTDSHCLDHWGDDYHVCLWELSRSIHLMTYSWCMLCCVC